MIKEHIELLGGVTAKEDVEKRIRYVGVRGMDMEQAKEVGFFNRVSNLLCTVHATIVAAYHIYGYVDWMLTDYGCRKFDISRAMNDYEKAFDRFYAFWTDYYAKGAAKEEINSDAEELYHRIMAWAQMPERWNLGDPQRTKGNQEPAIKLTMDNNRELYFHKTVINNETVGEIKESWCVTKYNERENKQETIYTDMDKASAIMVAKRLSDDDKDCIYTASIVQEITECKETVTPFKAFKNNETIGKLTKIEP